MKAEWEVSRRDDWELVMFLQKHGIDIQQVWNAYRQQSHLPNKEFAGFIQERHPIEWTAWRILK